MLEDPRYDVEGLNLPRGANSGTKPSPMIQPYISKVTRLTWTRPREFWKLFV